MAARRSRSPIMTASSISEPPSKKMKIPSCSEIDSRKMFELYFPGIAVSDDDIYDLCPGWLSDRNGDIYLWLNNVSGDIAATCKNIKRRGESSSLHPMMI